MLKSSFFIGLISISVFSVFIQADGTTDAYYKRFTTPQQSSLIIGTSRAAQAIQPKILTPLLKKYFLNYAFTLSSSPYGVTYLNSIKKKVNPKTKNGIFIITVDPWSISHNKNDTNNFSEVDQILGTTSNVNSNPNINYLLNSFHENYSYILKNKTKNNMFLHDNGWLEININMNSNEIEKRTNSKVENYLDHLNNLTFSESRFQHLKKIITFLNKHGKTYLVRLPVHPKIMDVENQLIPNFNSKINNILPLTSGYLDLTPYNSDYIYTDGNHLYKESGELVTQEIGLWIKSIEENPLKK